MTSTAITGIGQLVSCDLDTDHARGPLGVIEDAAVIIEDASTSSGTGAAATGSVIGWVGPATAAPAADRAVDLGGRCLLPGFVDSHTHLVYAGDRSAEFAARMAGQSYDGGAYSERLVCRCRHVQYRSAL